MSFMTIHFDTGTPAREGRNKTACGYHLSPLDTCMTTKTNLVTCHRCVTTKLVQDIIFEAHAASKA